MDLTIFEQKLENTNNQVLCEQLFQNLNLQQIKQFQQLVQQRIIQRNNDVKQMLQDNYSQLFNCQDLIEKLKVFQQKNQEHEFKQIQQIQQLNINCNFDEQDDQNVQEMQQTNVDDLFDDLENLIDNNMFYQFVQQIEKAEGIQLDGLQNKYLQTLQNNFEQQIDLFIKQYQQNQHSDEMVRQFVEYHRNKSINVLEILLNKSDDLKTAIVIYKRIVMIYQDQKQQLLEQFAKQMDQMKLKIQEIDCYEQIAGDINQLNHALQIQQNSEHDLDSFRQKYLFQQKIENIQNQIDNIDCQKQVSNYQQYTCLFDGHYFNNLLDIQINPVHFNRIDKTIQNQLIEFISKLDFLDQEQIVSAIKTKMELVYQKLDGIQTDQIVKLFIKVVYLSNMNQLAQKVNIELDSVKVDVFENAKRLVENGDQQSLIALNQIFRIQSMSFKDGHQDLKDQIMEVMKNGQQSQQKQDLVNDSSNLAFLFQEISGQQLSETSLTPHNIQLSFSKQPQSTIQSFHQLNSLQEQLQSIQQQKQDLLSKQQMNNLKKDLNILKNDLASGMKMGLSYIFRK